MKTSIMILWSSFLSTTMIAQSLTNNWVIYTPKTNSKASIQEWTTSVERKENVSTQLLFIPYGNSTLLAAYPDKGLRRTVKGTIIGNSETIWKPLQMILTTSNQQTTIMEPCKILFPKKKRNGMAQSLDDYIELTLPNHD
ncbi:MAG: hypothetical protein RLZZ628_3497 [Bacteroidota bacterium]|jgi:hypothetical protein